MLGTAQLMVILDTTIVNIALPTAQQALRFSNADRQWVITAYALAFGSLLLLGGRLSDLIGRKWALVTGLVGFVLASAVGGFADSFAMLVAARAVQGAFGAALAPAVLSLLSTTFVDPRERGRAFAVYAAIAGAGGAIGLLLGGVLTSYASWRWTLFVNLAFAAVDVPVALALVRDARPDVRPRLDLPGIATVTAGLFAVVYGLSHAQTTSWGNTTTVASLAAGVVLLAAFTLLQHRGAHPLLPLRVVLDRNRGTALLVMFLVGAGLFGVFLFLTYYLQGTLGYTPVQTGLAFIPMVVVLAAFSQLANRVLLVRFGPKPLVAVGMAVAAGAMVLFTGLGLHSTYAGHVLVYLIVAGAGLGLTLSPVVNTATFGVWPEDAGVASAMVTTAQQVGGSMGTALLNTIAVGAGTHWAATHYGVPDLVARATVHGYTTAFAWSVGLFGLGAVAAAVVMRRGALRPAEAPADEGVPVLVDAG